MRMSVFATISLLVFLIITICFGLRPSSSETNIEYTNGNFAKLTNGSVVGALISLSLLLYSRCNRVVVTLLDELCEAPEVTASCARDYAFSNAYDD
jgi:hypothetical protein